MSALTVQPLTAAEARELTDRIRSTAIALHDHLLEAYSRGAWSALGYGSWREYATAELSISQSHAYRLLDHARVVAAITEAAGAVSPVGEISEREARDVKPVLPEVVEAVREKVAAGAEPTDAVRDAVTEAREARRDEAFSDAVHGDEPAGPRLVEDDDTDLVDGINDGPTLAELVDELQRDNARLEDLVDSLSTDDTAAELVRWRNQYSQLEGRLQQEMNKSREAIRQAEYQAGVLKRIREALGVRQTQEIIPAIREMRRAA